MAKQVQREDHLVRQEAARPGALTRVYVVSPHKATRTPSWGLHPHNNNPTESNPFQSPCLQTSRLD